MLPDKTKNSEVGIVKDSNRHRWLYCIPMHFASLCAIMYVSNTRANEAHVRRNVAQVDAGVGRVSAVNGAKAAAGSVLLVLRPTAADALAPQQRAIHRGDRRGGLLKRPAPCSHKQGI